MKPSKTVIAVTPPNSRKRMLAYLRVGHRNRVPPVNLNDKIIETVKRKGLTHERVATLAHTSQTRITAIMNRNTHDISTDLLLRVMGSLGVHATIRIQKNAA